jgi:hypothetical protein
LVSTTIEIGPTSSFDSCWRMFSSFGGFDPASSLEPLT